MKYLLKQITIYESTNQRGAYSWLQARLFNDIDVFGNPAQLPRYYNMTEEVVALYKPYGTLNQARSAGEVKVYNVDETKLQEAIAKGAIGDILHIDQIHSVVVPLPGWYARIHKTDIINNGNLVAKKGDFVRNDAGEVIPVDSLELYLKKYFDPNEKDEAKAWKWVEAPERAMRNVLARNYKQYAAPKAAAAAPDTAPAPKDNTPTPSTEDEIAKAREILARANAS